MKGWKRETLTVNGFEVEADYKESTVEKVFIPLLKKMDEIQKEKGRRILVFLAAPPAVGKSTLAEYLQVLSKRREGLQEIQALGLDGFHYHSDYIAGHEAVVDGIRFPMQSVKGCPETFDLEKLKKKLDAICEGNILWPVYDRNRHDVTEDVIKVEKNIILLEGNWLLLKDDGWKELKKKCDFSILIRAEEEALKERLIQRKIRGGFDRAEAEDFYEQSDSKNVIRVLRNSQKADVTIRMKEDNDYEEEA
ncbi:MAG: nucleoside/nucleotide kinase family protein [Lachnospiraceae bacterium]|nr:nucleoside/nucleotide kinase family protein [Lachnospiraceae bacterium]